MSKYKNPIAKVTMVTIPTWEYVDLVRSRTMLEMTERIVNGLDDYRVRDTLKVLFDGGKEDVE